MKTALVTGNMGFIGSHMQRRLLADGWEVACCDNRNGPSGDCRKIFVGDYRFDLIIHAAACVGGRVGIDGAPTWVAQDLAIDSDFFQYVKRIKPKRAIYFSSSAAYPIDYQRHFHSMRMEESMVSWEHEPDAIYGRIKLMGEYLAKITNNVHNCVQVFRPFSGYGHDQDLDYPFPSFVERAMRLANPFEVWGDGRQVRDWIHVDDIVEMTIGSLDFEEPMNPINMCTGIGMSMREVAGMIVDNVGYRPEFVMKPEAPTGVEYRVGDPTKMNALFGAPQVSLEEGISRAVFYQTKMGGYRG